MSENLKAPVTMKPQTAQTSERWRKFVPMIDEDMRKAKIDAVPRNLAAIVAKVHTGESIKGKGLFLIGGAGTGKTVRMKFIATLLEIRMITAVDLMEELMQAETLTDKEDALNCTPPHWSEVPPHWNDLIIDDLGTEPDGQKVYGTKRYLMEDAICRRYECFTDCGRRWKTHFTSNLKPEEIRARYGERVWSRLNEMVVFVTLAGKDRRIG